MTKLALATTNDFNIEVRGAIFLHDIDCHFAISNFDLIAITIDYEAIELSFYDDDDLIGIRMPHDELPKLIIKIAVEGSMQKSMDLLKDLIFSMVITENPVYELLRKHLIELRSIHQVIEHEFASYFQANHHLPKFDPEKHICFWELEGSQGLTSIEQWHKEWLSKRNTDKAA